MKNVHIPVLLNEVIDGLKFEEGDIFLDATYGGGGHSREIKKRFGDNIEMIGIDLDPSTDAVHENFRNLDKVLDKLGHKKVNKILMDLGWSSNQLELSGRGFSFQKDEPLQMTFSSPEKSALSAKQIVNTWQEENLADILYGFGGERLSRRIAKAIVETRKKQMIDTTFQLVEIIRRTVPVWYRNGKIHFATRTFQALRIAVNDELGALQEGLEKGYDKLDEHGRMAVITFHSLEDRTVKQFFKNKKIINKKPIRASLEEIKANPRARSAKLRLIEKVNENKRIETT